MYGSREKVSKIFRNITKPMNLLLIDTSTKHFSLAISKGDKVIIYRNIYLKKVLSSSIIPAIERILNKAKVSLEQLDGFAVGLGPGSFTSLRVGLSTIKALALAIQKPIVGIPSLDLLAMNYQAKEPVRVCSLVDARRNLVYACLYEKNNLVLKRKSEYLLTSIDDLFNQLKADSINDKIIFIGDGVALFKEQIIQKAKILKTKWIPEFQEKNIFPQARNLLSLVQPRFTKKKYDHVDKLLPLYLYPEDCQVRS